MIDGVVRIVLVIFAILIAVAVGSGLVLYTVIANSLAVILLLVIGLIIAAIVFSFLYAKSLRDKKHSYAAVAGLLIARWAFCLVGGVTGGFLLLNLIALALTVFGFLEDPDAGFGFTMILIFYVAPVCMVIAAIVSWWAFKFVSDKLIEKKK